VLIQQQNRQRKYARYQQVRALIQTGASKAEIARQLGLDHRTVRKFMHAEIFPEAKPRVRWCIVDPYAEYLDRRLLEGCRSPTRLRQELRDQGFPGKENIVRYWLLGRRGHLHHATPPQRPALRASPRQTVWFMLKETAYAQSYLEEVYRASPVVAQLAQMGREFFRIIHDRDLAALPEWLAAAKNTALAGFANRLTRDQEAVEAALKLPWSQGHVEGQVHRLKLIKRQM
jgi:transposase